MKRAYWLLVVIIGATAVSTRSALPQERPPQPPPAPEIKYEELAPGIQAAHLLRSDALRDGVVEIQDVIIGPGKSATDLPVRGFMVTELKSGDLETTIDSQATKRRPGEFWVVRPGQKYAVKSLGAMVVLHVTIFSRP